MSGPNFASGTAHHRAAWRRCSTRRRFPSPATRAGTGPSTSRWRGGRTSPPGASAWWAAPTGYGRVSGSPDAPDEGRGAGPARYFWLDPGTGADGAGIGTALR
ncbi:MAG: hypothetical protein OXH76_11215 [Boseongicola sp.]|nr:hypothetical protein [Boseongicola sp.]